MTSFDQQLKRCLIVASCVLELRDQEDGATKVQRGSMKSFVQNKTESGFERMLFKVEVWIEANAFFAFLVIWRTVGTCLLSAENTVDSKGRFPFTRPEFTEGSLETAEAAGRASGRAMF